MPTQNLKLLNSLMDQVKKEWSIPADCNDNTILFNVVKEAFIRYEAEVNQEMIAESLPYEKAAKDFYNSQE